MDDLESDQESDIGSLNSEILQEREFQAEMDRYDLIMARAHEIVERRRREELEDNDILADEDSNSNADSELSMLASSQFNGMEGIEGMEGMEGSGSTEPHGSDDDTSTLGIAFSPRKTRSGKLVGYCNEK